MTAGLDIGTHCVKLACLDQSNENPRLVSFGIEELQPDAILAGEVRDREGVIRSIQTLIDRSSCPLKEVVVSLSGNEVLSEVLTIGAEFEGKSDEVVKQEVERINPFDFDIGSVTLDYNALERETQSDQLKVLRIAAKNEVLYNKYIDVLSGSQLRPAILDVDFCALINVFFHNYDAKSFETVALVNIGVEGTSAVFLRNGNFHLARELPIGVDAFIKEIQRDKKVKVEEANRFLRDAMENGTDDKEMEEAIERVGQEMAKEFDMATSFLRSASVYESLDCIFISGGGAVVPGMTDVLSEYTRTPVTILNPLAAIKYDYSLFGEQKVENVSPLLALAIGLALRKDN